MKKFIKAFVVFVTPLILLILLSVVIVFFYNDASIEKFRFKKEINKIAIGDSHIRLSIDDSYLPNTKNISLDSESYLYTYYKLKILFLNNPLIDTVYLGSSYHNFSAYYDDATKNHQVILSYFFILPTSERIDVIKKIDNPIKFLISVIKRYFRKKNNTWLGCYADYTTKDVLTKSAQQGRINSQYYIKGVLQNFSDENIYYFNKIVELCKKSKVQLIIINTPLYSEYTKMIPTRFINNYDNLMSFHRLRVIEFDVTNFNTKDFLPDGDHVSRSGAIKTTLQLKDMK